MKKCPYCAEEIQDGAVFCRFCDRRVKGALLRRIMRFAVLAAVICALVIYYPSIKRATRSVDAFFISLKTSMEELLKSIVKGVAALENFNRRAELIEDMSQRIDIKEKQAGGQGI